MNQNLGCTLTIDGTKKGATISPTFMGVFFEDINYGADGGLYAELINNRSFEFGSFKDTFSVFDDYFYAWSVVEKEGAKLKHTLGCENPIHPNNPHYLSVTVECVGEGVGITNAGFDGIAVEEGKQYNASLYIRAKAYAGNVVVKLESVTGEVYGTYEVPATSLTSEWQKFEGSFVSSQTDAMARLSVCFDAEGELDVEMISLFPEETWNNRKNGLRKDLVQMLYDLKPKFMRFPGGCIVEGKYLTNAYNWKQTRGPVEHRKINWNRWEEPHPYPYNQSYGLGFYEYFLLSEDIGASPLPILNCGMSCQFQGGEVAENLEPYIQDVLDLIEYANGEITTTWGAMRAEDGHAEPFNLVYVGIGNEQWIDYDREGYDKYFEIFEIFRSRIKEKHPEIELVTTSGPFPEWKEFDNAWEIINQKTEEYIAKGEVYAEMIDEHYYMSPEWFLDNNDRYDNYPRYADGKSNRIFAGEYACHMNGGPSKQGENTLFSALCEAAFMTGLERNSDIVAMTAYAPLFAKHGKTQWKPDLIWFDNTTSYGSANYYVQKMFGNNMGTYIVETAIESNQKLNKNKRFPIYNVVAKDETTGDLIIKLVNVDEKPWDVDLEITGVEGIKAEVSGKILTSLSKVDVNTLTEPSIIVDTDFVLDHGSTAFRYTIPAQAFVVLRMHTK